jgi:hypothetical protein
MGMVGLRLRRRFLRTPRAALVVLFLAAFLPACTVFNSVDVCARGGEESEVNARTEGDQVVYGQGALAALPGGGALVAFESPVSAIFPGQSEIRTAALDRHGHRLSACSEAVEATLAGPRIGDAEPERAR